MIKDTIKISFEIWTCENENVNIWSTKWSTVLTNCIIYQNVQNFRLQKNIYENILFNFFSFRYVYHELKSVD